MVTAVATMGCGCSRTGTGSRPTSGRRVNPSESSGSTPERGYGLKANGCLTNGLTATSATAGGRPVRMIHRGVDTGSLRNGDRYSPLWFRRGGRVVTTTNTGVQCDYDEDNHRFLGGGSGDLGDGHPDHDRRDFLFRTSESRSPLDDDKDSFKDPLAPSSDFRFVRLKSGSGNAEAANGNPPQDFKLERSEEVNRWPLDDDNHDGFPFQRSGTGSGSSWISSRCSSLNRKSRRRSLAAAAKVSLSTNNLPRISSASEEWSPARLASVNLLSTSGFLPPIEGAAGSGSKTDASSQTEHCAGGATAVPQELFPRPPASRKLQLLKNRDFAELDKIAREVPVSFTSSVHSLVSFLGLSAKTDLELVRSFYVWIAHHVRYDIKYADVDTNPEDTLELRAGVSKDYCQLFTEMCRLSDIRVEVIRGFAKGFSHNAGHNFRPGQDGLHSWNAVFLGGSWRLVDCTWGTGIVNSLGRFQERFSEHFFLTDPDVFSWTHFPHDPSQEENYSRWQLMENPLSLERFNALPKVFPHFFVLRMKTRTVFSASPITFAYTAEVVLWSPQVLRYKYKMYPADAVEDHSLDQYVFCQLTEQRLRASFAVGPPDDGDYVLKVYAGPEEEEERPESVLQCVAAFAFRCTRTRKNVTRYPPNELPWGLTGHMASLGLKVLNVFTPVMVVVTGRKCLLLETDREVLVTHQLTDVHGRDVPSKNTVGRTEDKDNKLIRFLIQPPEVGLYRFSLYACLKPEQRGQWRLPCVATYLVDCKQTLYAAGELREQIFVKKTKKANP